MAPPTTAPATTTADNNSAPRRQSCDRCYGQKLRCTRAGNSFTGACTRCLRRGTQCVYSFSLPKGRPSMYRTATEAANKAAAQAAAQAASKPPVTPASSTTSEHRRRPSAASHTTNHTAPSDTTINSTTDNFDNDDSLDTSMGSSWPWPDQIDWGDHQFDNLDMSQNHMAEPVVDVTPAVMESLPNIVNWASTEIVDHSGSQLSALPSPPIVHHNVDPFQNHQTPMMSINTDKQSPHNGIAQLAQLSTRLYPVHRSSCALAESAEMSGPGHRKPLLDDSAYCSLAGWLVHITGSMYSSSQTASQAAGLESSSAGGTLHHAFSASHHLLEILRSLQIEEMTSATGTPSGLDFWNDVTPLSLSSTPGSHENVSFFDQVKSPTRRHYPNQVVRHLVIACHTLLFNIYVTVLMVLQHDADLGVQRSQAEGFMNNPAPMCDIRLVLVVQLCSYFTERQRHAVDSYLSPQLLPTAMTSTPYGNMYQGSSSPNAHGNREAMSQLEIEVQQRLTRLRQTLRI